MKRCSKCKIEKPFNEFNKNSNKRDGCSHYCKECKKLRRQALEHKEKMKSYRQTLEHKEKMKLLRQTIKYKESKKSRRNQEGYREDHREYMRKRSQLDIRKEYMRKYQKNRRNTDLVFKLNKRLANAIYLSLKGNKNGRHWEELVEYTLGDLMKHLESKFLFEMTWENYGQWHIDHIRPISSFKFTSYNDLEFKQCWSLSNLQPLWAIDNIRKSNKLAA